MITANLSFQFAVKDTAVLFRKVMMLNMLVCTVLIAVFVFG